MATANKTPPMIAPGILCPKCKGVMTDERANKRTEKSPDYQCANVMCTDPTGKYRTGVWVEKSNGSAGGEMSKPTGTSASPSLADSGTMKPTMREAYKSLTEWVIKEIAPLYEHDEYGLSPEAMASCVHTLFIQACKSGKVE
jgi:hypothetical protein